MLVCYHTEFSVFYLDVNRLVRNLQVHVMEIGSKNEFPHSMEFAATGIASNTGGVEFASSLLEFGSKIVLSTVYWFSKIKSCEGSTVQLHCKYNLRAKSSLFNRINFI